MRISDAGYSEYNGEFGLQIDLDDGTSLYVMSDSEGSGVGSVQTSNPEARLFPVIRAYRGALDAVRVWNKKAERLLVGKEIADVRYSHYEDTGEFGLELRLSDGTRLYVMRDDEGNGVGALHTNLERIPILPSLSSI